MPISAHNRLPVSTRLKRLLVLAVGAFVALEVLSWGVLFIIGDTAPVPLRVYQQMDTANHVVKLKPGFTATLEELQKIDPHYRNPALLKEIADYRKLDDVKSDGPALQINQDGFRGPEIGPIQPGVPRIIINGDNLVFGLPGAPSIADLLQARLKNLGVTTSVINAGVEGYRTTDLIKRVNDYANLKPDLAIVLIGFNDYMRTEPAPLESWSGILRLIHRFHQGALHYASVQAAQQPDDPRIKALASYTPPMAKQLDKLLQAYRESGTRVIVVTLPMLFDLGPEITPEALAKGELPGYLNNPYVLRAINRRYNASIRQVAQNQHAILADTSSWIHTFYDPERFFLSTTQLTPTGQAVLADFLADSVYSWTTTEFRQALSPL